MYMLVKLIDKKIFETPAKLVGCTNHNMDTRFRIYKEIREFLVRPIPYFIMDT